MTQLVRHGAPVYGEIVGELLSVKGISKDRLPDLRASLDR